MLNSLKMLLKLLLVLIWLAAGIATIGLIIGLVLDILEINSVFSRILPSWSAWTYLLAIASLAAVQYLIAKVVETKESNINLNSPWIG